MEQPERSPALDWLNYHHLRYFWAAVREGGVTQASRKLHVSQPTVSAQIGALEAALGEKLFSKSGRTLRLTDVGRVVYRYADEIFGLGRELLGAIKGAPGHGPLLLSVGIANVVPKLIAYRLLEPALDLPKPGRVVCFEDQPERLLAKLAGHELDLVLSDAPVGPGQSVRAYNHLLGECGVSVFGEATLVRGLAGRSPRALDGAPFLLPSEPSALRRSLDQWFEAEGIRPRVVAEFEDSALLRAFGEAGRGFFAVPTVSEAEVERHYRVARVLRLESVRERFYAISVERRLKHPAVVAISQAAREELFA